ncbi:uncharacterized protein LOC126997269, partial [Eriocheir sinensis]|uniref:uncharacterized protein LOC126997269 n=1 Tax=Eriocheir sinensis TaxID=95602 RepID=UPI0021C7A3FD
FTELSFSLLIYFSLYIFIDFFRCLSPPLPRPLLTLFPLQSFDSFFIILVLTCFIFHLFSLTTSVTPPLPLRSHLFYFPSLFPHDFSYPSSSSSFSLSSSKAFQPTSPSDHPSPANLFFTDAVDTNSWIQLTPRRRHYFGHHQKASSVTAPPAGGASASQATWVRRPFEDDDDLQPPEGKIYLSDFQVEKFTYYFTYVFDHNKDRVITIEDIHALNERMRHYAGWSEDNEYYLTMKEIHADFFECLLEHVGKIEPEYGFEFDVDRIPDRVQMYQWLNMWGNLVHGARAMMDFPIWLQILPKILFKVINRRDDGIVSYDELRSFYALFIKLPEDQVENITEEAYRALTSSGDFPLTERVYLMAFANFLLGKTPHGPGKYIFGGFKDSEVGLFQVDYSCLLEPKED